MKNEINENYLNSQAIVFLVMLGIVGSQLALVMNRNISMIATYTLYISTYVEYVVYQ